MDAINYSKRLEEADRNLKMLEIQRSENLRNLKNERIAKRNALMERYLKEVNILKG